MKQYKPINYMAGTSSSLVQYGRQKPPTTLLNAAVSAEEQSLAAVSSSMQMEEQWKARDHLRYVVMLMTWTAVWVLRAVMDHLPSSLIGSSQNVLSSIWSSLLGGSSPLLLLPSSSSLDLILQDDDDGDEPSGHALGRSLTHILALLNDIPATSKKYQFTMSMADNIMDGNFREGSAELLQVNRIALSSAFDRTLSLLCRALESPSSSGNICGALATRVIKLLPMGSHITSYVTGFNLAVGAVLDTVRDGLEDQASGRRGGGKFVEGAEDVVAEKLVQELLWMTQKLRGYGAVDEAMVQWSCAYGLASLARNANPRVQGHSLKISATLIGDLTGDVVVSTEVKFGLLANWVPLLVDADNGLAEPFLTSFEKTKVERAMDEAISTLPAMAQEIILTSWVQDFAASASDWPNLQVAYDRWCRSTRELAAI